MSALACPRCQAALTVTATRDSHVTVACHGCRTNVVVSERTAPSAPSDPSASPARADSLRPGGLLILLAAMAAGVISARLGLF